MTREIGWRIAQRVLLGLFILAAALNMLDVHAGFLTSHLADLVVPAWMYVVSRGLHAPGGRAPRIQRTLGRSPEVAALSLFVASALTEISQLYWPHGVFRGRFDPLDIVAYGAGLAMCYTADRLWGAEPAGASAV
jgi:hypothetical protein